jgi:flavin reductase
MAASVETLFPSHCEPAEFVDSMSRAINGVSIVTTDGPYGRFGLTVSSMTSVSASPPMLLVCVNRDSMPHDAIRGNGRFAISVLGAGQQILADRFAGRGDDPYVFDAASWYSCESLPRLRDAAAWFDCRLSSAMSAGSHSIFIGEVVEAHSGDQAPLLYTNRRYGRPTLLN